MRRIIPLLILAALTACAPAQPNNVSDDTDDTVLAIGGAQVVGYDAICERQSRADMDMIDAFLKRTNEASVPAHFWRYGKDRVIAYQALVGTEKFCADTKPLVKKTFDSFREDARKRAQH